MKLISVLNPTCGNHIQDSWVGSNGELHSHNCYIRILEEKNRSIKIWDTILGWTVQSYEPAQRLP